MLSIVTRALCLSDIEQLYTTIKRKLSKQIELIVVARKENFFLSDENVTVIIEDSNRFEARKSGILAAKGNILLLDNDQIPSELLLIELQNIKADAVIIPERSLNRNLVGRLLDFQRNYFQELAKPTFSPYFPVVPRFYRNDIIKNVVNNLDTFVFKYGLSHEDSILYYEIYKDLKYLTESKNYIYNLDPSMLEYIRKSILYGRYRKSTFNAKRIPKNYIDLINEINKEFLRIRNNKSILNLCISSLRAVPYFFGSL